MLIAIPLSTGCGGKDKKAADSSQPETKAQKLLKKLPKIAARAKARREKKWKEIVQGGDAKLQIVGFPNQTRSLQVGQVVFSPHPKRLAEAKASSDRRHSLSYGAYEVVTMGDHLAGLKRKGDDNPLDDDVKAVPYGWLIPLPSAQEVKVGDWVIGTWSGSEMGHMVVAEVGDKPRARVQNMDQVVDLEAGSYSKLSADWQPGTFVALRVPPRIDRSMIVGVKGDQVLIHDLSGPKVVAKKDVIAIPPRPEVKPGDRVWGYWSSTAFRQGTLESIDEAKGEYVVKLDTRKGDGEMARIPFGGLTKKDLGRLPSTRKRDGGT